ncbi:TetR-like C-terminal domain-containing protein [Nocardia brasiliensis]|uniref:TetR-like C-terminal domain-containing protein n=1 Tax=Nocardia brasiliensis TaxID=37326 RepID=UPI0018932F84|nr:TetR-like C-terminal domain-containing protein [Nocardia brasiliensis]MBF6541474.1 TetR/AcrR family transcriptional regulator C-terminal ligand-binding domain-containing protein [Nocardia brasiliensis]
MTQTHPGRPRPGGRTARTRQKVHDAVRSLFGEGRDVLSIREVSERSGVHEVTLYRRWGTIESLVLDVAVTQLIEESPFPDSGDLRRDLLEWSNAVAAQVQTHEGFAFYRALAMARSALYAQDGARPTVDAAAYLRRRMAQIQQAIDHHRAANGGDPPTVERIFDIVLAPIYLRAIFGYSAPDLDLERLVDRALTEGD